MSKHRNDTLNETANAALLNKSEGAAVSAAPVVTPEQMLDPSQYLAGFMSGEPSSKPLPFAPDFDGAHLLDFRYFRPDEIAIFPIPRKRGDWQVVKVGEATENIQHSEIFGALDDPDSPWDNTGRIPFGRMVGLPGGGTSREQYLCVRPMGAKRAEQMIRERRTDEQTSPTQSRLAQATAGLTQVGPDGTTYASPATTDPSGQPLQGYGQPVITSAGWGQISGQPRAGA